jgi:hypothetical protein
VSLSFSLSCTWRRVTDHSVSDILEKRSYFIIIIIIIIIIKCRIVLSKNVDTYRVSKVSTTAASPWCGGAKISSSSRPILGGIQNIPDWCRYLYSSYSSAKHRSQQAKLWIPSSTTTFCGDCVKTREDVAPNFGENRPGCFIMTMPCLTLQSSPSSFWWNTKWLSSLTHRNHLIWFPWLIAISKNETVAEMTPVWYQWGNTGRIEESAWHSDRKGIPRIVPKMEEMVGPVSTCGRELLRGWWRPTGLMMSFMIFTASVRNILDTLSYINYITYFGHTTVHCNALKPKITSPLKLLEVGHPPIPSESTESNTTRNKTLMAQCCGCYIPVRLPEIRGNG